MGVISAMATVGADRKLTMGGAVTILDVTASDIEDADDALTITMTPVQMAALFTGRDISQEASLSNRLSGTAALVESIF